MIIALMLLGGLAALVAGAELLVRGAATLARVVGLSPLAIGLTVVAYGTSAPELAVSIDAAAHGQADMALGNVVGSNIFNLLAIVGMCAALTPLVVSSQLLRFDVWALLFVSLAAVALAFDGTVSRSDGALLVVGLVLYTGICLRLGRTTADAGEHPAAAPRRPSIAGNALLALAGLGLLVVGADWLVTGAVGVARSLGVSELTIGLTLVAAGTSLPELATSLVAAARGAREIAIGNVVGSNIFNLLGVLGLAAASRGDGVPVAPGAGAFDLPLMLVVTVVAVAFFASGRRVDRWEGVVLLAGYAAYLVALLARA